MKNFLNLLLPVGINADTRSILLLLCLFWITEDGSSLIIAWKSCFIAVTGLNFIGAIGVGKNACSVISKSLLTKLFVACCAGALDGAVYTCCGMWEGAVALGSAMVEGVGSVIDPCRLM